MSSSCAFQGIPSTYGLGIRTSFYLVWYTIPLSHWLCRTETKLIRFIHSLLIAGVFLGLIIQVSDNDKERQFSRAVEIYIAILLVIATYLYYIPLYIWRTLTCFRAGYDPERYPLVREAPIFALLNYFLIGAVVIFKIWFWVSVVGTTNGIGIGRTGAVSGLGGGSCEQYGFFFSKVGLGKDGFVVGNLIIAFVMLFGWAILGVVTCFKMRRAGWVREVVDDDGHSVSITSSEYDEVIDVGKLRETALQELATFFYLITVSTVLAAIELTISWNEIQGVNNVNSPVQTVPLVIGAAMIGRVFYIALLGDLDERYRIRKGRGVELTFVEWRRWVGAGSKKKRRRRRSRSTSERSGGV